MPEVREASLKVAKSAQRLLSIFTQDLEPLIYGEEPFLEAIKRLVFGRAPMPRCGYCWRIPRVPWWTIIASCPSRGTALPHTRLMVVDRCRLVRRRARDKKRLLSTHGTRGIRQQYPHLGIGARHTSRLMASRNGSSP